MILNFKTVVYWKPFSINLSLKPFENIYITELKELELTDGIQYGTMDDTSNSFIGIRKWVDADSAMSWVSYLIDDPGSFNNMLKIDIVNINTDEVIYTWTKP